MGQQFGQGIADSPIVGVWHYATRYGSTGGESFGGEQHESESDCAYGGGAAGDFGGGAVRPDFWLARRFRAATFPRDETNASCFYLCCRPLFCFEYFRSG